MTTLSIKFKLIAVELLFIPLCPLLKSWCCRRGVKIAPILAQFRFHNSIVARPAIMFYETNVLPFPFSKILAALSVKLFNCCISHNLLRGFFRRALKIKEPYLYNKELFFENGHNPYQKITVPENSWTKTPAIAVYTVDFGGYDKIFDPLVVSENCDYFLFTDNEKIKTAVWQKTVVDTAPFGGALLCSRFYKMFPHKVLDKKYDYSIYLDAKKIASGDIAQLVKFVGIAGQARKAPSFAAIRHNVRHSMKEEIAACIRSNRVLPQEAERQYSDYIAQGFPDSLDLIDCACLIRKHSDTHLQKAMEIWYEEFCKYPPRDQFSIMFALWKSGFEGYHIIESNIYHNNFIQQSRIEINGRKYILPTI
jgi:hypothetical protein